MKSREIYCKKFDRTFTQVEMIELIQNHLVITGSTQKPQLHLYTLEDLKKCLYIYNIC